MAVDVHRRHQQLALQHLRLDEHAQLTADVPRIDGLDGRLIVRWQFHQVHHLGTIEKFPPVQVAPVVGGEIVLEERMVSVDIGSCGVRRTHLEP